MDLSLGGVKSFGKSLHARVASTAKSLEVHDTGNAKVDAMGDVINNALAPFHEAPDPKKGMLGVVEQGINAVMGLQNAPMELMNTGFAMLTAPLAAMMPAFPAATLTAPHIGVPHAHTHPPSLIPPAPPVPLPSIGTVMAAGCVSVLIGGLPAARCGDLGLAPTCGSLAPAFDIFLGSSNTFIGGNRAARLSDVTRHCNPASKSMVVSRGAAIMSAAIAGVGAAASAAAGQMMQAAMQAAQIAADAAAAAMSALCGSDPGIPPAMGALMFGAPNVLIGGFPCPNLPNPLEMLMKGLKKLGKAIAASKAFGKLLSKVGLCNSPGEPINTFTGEVYNDFEDYHAVDSGFVWERHYRSGWNTQNGPLGYGFRHVYQRTLTLLRKRAIYETHDNEIVALERRPDGTFAAQSGFHLREANQGYQLRTDRNELLDFELEPGSTPPTARLTRYKTDKLDVYLFYDNANRLRALSEFSPGLTIDNYLVYGPSGYVEEIQRGVRGQQSQTIARYAYYDGCLVEWYDPLGAVTRFRYDAARRMVQGTDRRGYSFHWHYDPNTGRCIKSHGDDGLWGVEAKYEGTTSSFTEPDGGTWTFKHYPDGTISHIIDPLGGVKQYVRDDTGRVVKQLDPAGLEYAWLYDSDGKHIGRKGPFGNLVPPEDEEPNPPNPLRHCDASTQREWLCGRDTGRQVVTLPKLPATINEALTTLATSAGDGTPTSTLDAAGRVAQTVYPTGAIEYIQRDLEGNIVGRCDVKGRWWQQQITSWNLIGAKRSPLGAVTQYGYTHRQKRTFVIDPNGNRTDYRRDHAQRLIEIIQNGKPFLRYKRALNGTILEERDGDDAILVEYEANGLGLHTESKLASGEQYSYAYDALGNFTEASSSQHETRQHHVGYKLVADRRDGKGVEHEFDETGLASTVVLERFRTKYHFAGDALRIETPDGTEHRFWREAGGSWVRENANGTAEALLFDAKERLSARICWRWLGAAASITSSARYAYDPDGLLTRVIDSELGLRTYAYDEDNRLIAQESGNERFEYRYDAAGNLAYTPSHGHLERTSDNFLSHSHIERFEYDARHRLCKRVGLDGREIRYSYDSADQLVRVEWSDRPAVWRAAYDGLGRRLWREYNQEKTDFYWDGDRLAAEIAPDGALRVYFYANEDVLVPFMWLDYASVDREPATGIARYLFCDPTGMPLRVEDPTGQVIWRAKAIEPYGTLRSSEGQTTPLRLRFAGHFFDEHLELFYNRFRDYDPGLGRYLQPDPLGHAGGPNLYAYSANPAAEVDLRGLMHKKKGESHEGGDQNENKKPSKEAEEAAAAAAAAEAARRRALGEDPAVKKYRPNEEATAVRVENHEKVTLERFEPKPGEKGDWINKQTGTVYDGCSPAPSQHFDKSFPSFTQSLDDHLKHPTVDKVVVDTTNLNLTPQQSAKLDNHINSLPPNEQAKIVRIK